MEEKIIFDAKCPKPNEITDIKKEKEEQLIEGIKGGKQQKEAKENGEKKEEDKPPEEQGRNEAIKESVKEDIKAKKKFASLVKEAKQPLFRASSFFPFDLFPDEVTIDLSKVNIIVRFFVFSQQVYSSFIPDIKGVSVSSSILFATLYITSDTFKGAENDTIKVRFLKIRDAIKARKIIQGLIVAKKQDIDLLVLESVPDIIKKLEELGRLNIEQKKST